MVSSCSSEALASSPRRRLTVMSTSSEEICWGPACCVLATCVSEGALVSGFWPRLESRPFVGKTFGAGFSHERNSPLALDESSLLYDGSSL